jgi:site-specific DNA-methyltransferase (adenine-specific)
MNKIIQGNAFDVIKTISENTVDMIITSPPYFGLRDYGVNGQVGLERSPEEYVFGLCDLFDLAKKPLKNKGTLWVNIGDSYNSTTRSSKSDKKYYDRVGYNSSFNAREDTVKEPDRKPLKTIPKKSLMGVPFRFAVEMINRKWILRNTIIWHKPYCIPSSAKDRFTVDFEYLFFFSKSQKYYFKTQYEQSRAKGNSGNRIKRTIWLIPPARIPEAHFAVFPEELIEVPIDAACPEGGVVLDPFIGSGTTGLVAKKQNKNYIGIELNPDYIKIAEKRLNSFKGIDMFFNSKVKTKPKSIIKRKKENLK